MEAWDAAAWVVSVLGTTDANAVAALTGRTREQVLKVGGGFAELDFS